MDFDFTSALKLVEQNAWLPLAIFVVGYLVRLTADDSRFPVNVPKHWHPPVVVALAWLYGFLKVWPDWKTGLELPMLVSLAVLVLKAAFYGKEPEWLKRIAFVPKKTEGEPKADKTA